MIDRQLGATAEAALYRSVSNSELLVEHLTASDWARVADPTDKYADQHLGGVDAGLIELAERLGLTEIATLDHRHFGLVRPSHTDVLTVLP